MSTLSESSQDSLGWVYPAPEVEFISVPIADQRGITQLVSGQEYIDVVFHGSQTNTNWILVACEVVNTTDVTPLNLTTGIITSRSLSGFRVQLEGVPDTSNYFLHWAINGTVVPPTPATTYSLTGSSSGHIGAGATFVVELLPDTVVADTVTIVPGDGGGGGVFTPTSVELTSGDPSASFTYTPGLYGSKTISTTNDGELTDPAGVTFISTAATYTLSGPSTGTNGVESTDFTVALPASGVVIGTVTVTPSDGDPSTGNFTPTSVTLTTAAPSVTFTYTPASTGVRTISVTNDGGLTNPGSLTHTVTGVALLDTLISYWKMDEGTGSSGGTRNDSHGTNHLSDPTAAIAFASIINNGAYFSGAVTYLTVASNATLQVASDFTFSLWARVDSVAGIGVILYKGNAGLSATDYILYHDSAAGFTMGAGASVQVGAPASAFVFYHIVAWYDSSDSKMRLRINDATTYTGTAAALNASTTHQLNFGAFNAPSSYFTGLIDEVGFWKRVLTAGEITALYNGGAGLPYSSFTA